MDDIRISTIELPQFVIDSELSKRLNRQLTNDLYESSNKIVFDWSSVFFFDDYTLLKLILIQKQIRSRGIQVGNISFLTANAIPNHRRSVLRQLWAVGLPDLIASDHFVDNSQLKQVLEDEEQLLRSYPFKGLDPKSEVPAVIPMLCCHDQKYFDHSSREEKLIESFIWSHLSPSGSKTMAWDLIESRDFRHNMLQQLRRNVHEHSLPAIGIAIVRVWTSKTLSDEWELDTNMQAKLFRIWNKNPVSSVMHKIDPNYGVLQISVVDNGRGIPKNLESVHSSLLSKTSQKDLFCEDQLLYIDKEFEKRFIEPSLWKDEKAKLIAFATDDIGTSNRQRPPEVKGLCFLRKDTILKKGGEMLIESDGTAINNFTYEHEYGEVANSHHFWCEKGGTGICLAVPMILIERNLPVQRKTLTSLRKVTVQNEYTENRIKVREQIESSLNIETSQLPAMFEFDKCTKNILNAIVLPEADGSTIKLKRKNILLIDWGELSDSKRVLHILLHKIAKELVDKDPKKIRPFVFVNLPKGLCGLLSVAIGKYSKLDKPIPICAFTSEQKEPFWLGIEGVNLIPKELKSSITSIQQWKITDQKENLTEAFYRDCLNNLLNCIKPYSLSDTRILPIKHDDNYHKIIQTNAFSNLKNFVNQCSLFFEEEKSDLGETVFTKRFQPVFTFENIQNEVKNLFLDSFRETFTRPPVCFTPPNKKDGILLPHSNKVVKRCFRPDALIDSPISMELVQELTAIALSFANQMPNKRIDWVITCTAPLHWFVHKIVDGLGENNIICSHYVFRSFEAISTSIEHIKMRKDENMLVFVDVIASGQTAYGIAEALKNHFKVRIAGLIALADTRTTKDRKRDSRLEEIYEERIVCLYRQQEKNFNDELKAAYYIHPETVVPKRIINEDPSVEFFENNFLGTGYFINAHTFFSSANHTLDLIASLNAVQFGHFQHGNHHSEIFIDVEKILSFRNYRNIIITAIFKYIIDKRIQLVIYPSHSSIYLLVDDLKQRFSTNDSSIQFIMACRTFREAQSTSYSLTRFSPYPEKKWQKYFNNGVLILDDAICSAATVKSIMSELSRIERNYYNNTAPDLNKSNKEFKIHVVTLMNRMPRGAADFWKGLPGITAEQIQFLSFLSIPLASFPEELCPQCRLEKKIKYLKDSDSYSHYAKEFLSWWISENYLISSHERKHFYYKYNDHFLSKEILVIIGYLSAIERNGYLQICNKLYDINGITAEEKSKSIRVIIRSRAVFLMNMIPNEIKSMSIVDDLCNLNFLTFYYSNNIKLFP